MIPKSLSATSLQVANLCMARWEAEYMDPRVKGFENVAAGIGTAVHGALEKFVKAVYLDKTHEWSWNLLEQFYQISYIETFRSADYETVEYKDGFDLVKRWFKRTDLTDVTVESCEVKEFIEVPYIDPTTGEKSSVPFNYIMDRVDQTAETEWRVVDYKSVRVPIQPEDLGVKVQARAYALAVQIKHPEATKIRVVFDLLRHDPVGIVVTKEENIAFWKYLKTSLQNLVDTKPDDIRPTLNPECMYCPIKATCDAMQSNRKGGGIFSLTVDQLALKQVEVEAQIKAQKYILAEIEELLLKEAHERKELEWDTEDGTHRIEIKMSRRRQIDASEVQEIIGPELFGKLGNITLGVVDDLVKDPNLSDEQHEALKKLIYYKNGDPKPKVKKVTKLV